MLNRKKNNVNTNHKYELKKEYKKLKIKVGNTKVYIHLIQI